MSKELKIENIHECKCLNCQKSGEPKTKLIHKRMNLLLSRLDEQQRRWYVGLESSKIGHGGDVLLSKITGISEKTIQKGREEIIDELKGMPTDRVRIEGGGRPAIEEKTPEIESILLKIVEPDTAGDPMSKEKWVRRSLSNLSNSLKDKGYSVSAPTISRLLKKRLQSKG